MHALRRHFRNHRRLLLAFALLALALRALLPAGTMLAQQGRTLSVAICADATGLPKLREIVVPGMQRDGHQPAKAGMDGNACPYAGLAMASLAGADPVLLAAALALLMVLGLRPVATPPAAASRRLRPPLRAPPAFA
jgi:hypothetical protein